MINFVIWLLAGTLLGWLIGMAEGEREGRLLNILVGIVGAFIGGVALNVFGKDGPNSTINDFSISSLLASFVGAFFLLGMRNLFRYGSIR